MRFVVRLRWVAVGVFMLAAVVNFLDRQLLAAVAPTIKAEFTISNVQYGEIISAFSFVSAFGAPLAGLFVDAVGLTAGMCIAIMVWSLAGIGTGLVHSLRGLIVCRMALGLGESAGNLGAGKAGALYLDGAELGLAGGFGAASITVGSMTAPLMVAFLAPHYGWRSVFLISGVLGLLWVPLWLFTSKRIPPLRESREAYRIPMRDLLSDSRLWAITLAYALVYLVYSVWANWTTIYFVQERHLSMLEANMRFAWFPPAFAVLGGFLGGGLAFRWIRRRVPRAHARMRSCWFTAPLLISSALVSLMPSAALAAVAIGISFISLQSLLANLHVLLVDLFSAPRAAFTNSLSSSASYLLQSLVSPLIGLVIDRYGFAPLGIAVSILPLFGLFALQIILSTRVERTAASAAAV